MPGDRPSVEHIKIYESFADLPGDFYAEFSQKELDEMQQSLHEAVQKHKRDPVDSLKAISATMKTMAKQAQQKLVWDKTLTPDQIKKYKMDTDFALRFLSDLDLRIHLLTPNVS